MKLEEKSFNEISNILLARKDDYGEIYLIGGYLRDYLLNNINKDLDFVVLKNSAKAARAIADYFGGDFYMLDQERETARALITLENQQIIIDVALINGENILDDLKKRDFTINAMAINLAEPDEIIDPLGGKRDLQQKKLQPCSNKSFTDDPIRTLRAVRFIQTLSLNYDPHLKLAITEASKNLSSISAERIRDELCHILILSGLDQTLDLLIEFDLFSQVFPDLLKLKDIPPKLPHVNDAFTHSKRVIELLRSFLDSMLDEPKKSENVFLEDVLSLIGKYKSSLIEYIDNFKILSFSKCCLLVLAGLYHDSAKLNIQPVEDGGRIIYPNHAEKSAEIVQGRMKALAFSNEDINFVRKIIRYHMSEHLKRIGEDENPNRSIYRFFLETGDLGVMIGFFHLADIIATYEETLSSNRWNSAMKSVEKILDGWFNHFEDVISPTRLLNGNDLIKKFGLQPGRELGEILEKIREEQAAGTIFEKSSAFKFAEIMINKKK
jgi:tRNA nucleotidyltransferase/poly(A) polymerase